MQRIARLTLTFCAMLALTASPAFAQQFVVFSARHDAAASQVVLIGAGFRADMRILLNGAPLPNAAVSSGEMRANCRRSSPAPTARHRPRRGNAQRFMVTVNAPPRAAAACPEPMGPMGRRVRPVPGAAGTRGSQGAQGRQDPQDRGSCRRQAPSPIGPAGVAGAMGPAVGGPAGVAGPAARRVRWARWG
jgi:hypothetical protein